MTKRVQRKSIRRRRRKPDEKQREDVASPLTTSAIETSTIHVQSTHDRITQLSSDQQRAMVSEVARTQGNQSVNRLLDINANGLAQPLQTAIQRKEGQKKKDLHKGGRGPGKVSRGRERFYDVSGSTLEEVSAQLNRFDGFAAQTNSPITIQGQVLPKKGADGQLSVKVKWVIEGTVVHLPRWTGYDSASAAAQHEWDRFMKMTRQHEQQAHIDKAHKMVNELTDADSVIRGQDRAELKQNLEAKQSELRDKLQAIHDECDNGEKIDAILHP